MQLRVLNRINARVGDDVVVGISEAGLLRGSLAVYAAPLAGLFAGRSPDTLQAGNCWLAGQDLLAIGGRWPDSWQRCCGVYWLVALTNTGTISANGVSVDEQGNIELIAQQDITLTASSRISVDGPKAGKIQIESAQGTTMVEGRLTATSDEDIGGQIELLGKQVGVIGEAVIDASGRDGGGEVLIGGDYQGANPDVTNAKATYVGKDAEIHADALKNGDGGKVIVWGNDAARVHGELTAKGGSEGGDGGFIETSGKYLDVSGITIDAEAEYGEPGQWLLDPDDITIGVVDNNVTAGPTFDTTNSGATVSNTTIGNALSNGTSVIVQTGATNISAAEGNITVANNIVASNANATTATLSLWANNTITVNSGVQITATGNLMLDIDLFADQDSSGQGDIDLQAGTLIDANGGNVTLDSTNQFFGSGSSVFASNIHFFAPGSIQVSSGNVTWGGNTTIDGNITINGGNLSLNNDAYIDSSRSLNLLNGQLSSTGNLTIEGSYSDTSSAFMQIAGDIIFNQSGALNIDADLSGLVIDIVANGTLTGGGLLTASEAASDSITIVADSISNGNISSPIGVAFNSTLGGVNVTASGDVHLGQFGDLNVSDYVIDTPVGSNVSLLAVNGSINVDTPQPTDINITLYASGTNSDINVTQNVNHTAPAGTALTFMADRSVIFDSGADILTTNSTQITLVADADSSGAGNIQLHSGTQIFSSGGDISLGSVNGSAAIGIAATTNGLKEGIYFDNAQLTASGGNISIAGTGWGSSGNNNYGIYISNNSTIDTIGNGTINIHGTGGNTFGFSNRGVELSQSNIAAVNGDIAFNGTGRGTGRTSSGIQFDSNALVVTSGSGNITMTGNSTFTDTSGDGNARGIIIRGGSTLSAAGSGSILGNGVAGNANNPYGFGIYVIDNSSLSTSSGDINLTGSGTANYSGRGIVIDPGSVLTSNTGDISIHGSGSATSGNGHHGVTFYGGINITGNGNISIQGSGGGSTGSQNAHGIQFGSAGSFITSAGGEILINGTASNAGSNGTGVLVDAITMQAVDINVQGQGGGSGLDGIGVDFINSQLTASNNISVAGTGSAAASGASEGVVLDNAAMTASNININATAGNVSFGMFSESNGTLNVTGSVNLDTTGGIFIEDGTLAINGGNYTQTEDLYINSSATFQRAAGFTNEGNISGTGTVDVNAGTLVNNGTVSAGFSPGTLTVSGNYNQTASGLLDVELNGTTAGTDYDVLNVTGNANLDGTLNVTETTSFINGGETFTIINAGNVSGNFTTINAPAGVTIGSQYNATDVTLSADGVSNIWQFAINDNWSNATAWSRGLPTAFHDVLIDQAGNLTITVDSGAQTARSFTLGAGEVVEINGGNLTLTADTTIPVDSGFSLTSGVLNSGGNFTINGDYSDTAAGSMNITGLLTFQALSDLTIDGAVQAATAFINGAGNLTGSGVLTTTDGVANATSISVQSIGTALDPFDLNINSAGGSVAINVTGGDFYIEQATGDLIASNYQIESLADSTGAVSTANGNITIDATPPDVDGNLTIYAKGTSSNLFINDDLLVNGSAGLTLDLKADNSITVASNVAIASINNSVSITLKSDADASNAGNIKMNTGSFIVSNGGTIELIGGSAAGAVGTDTGFNGRSGIILDNAALSAGGGNITMVGTGFAGTAIARGVSAFSSSVISTNGSGQINIMGTGGLGTDDNRGIYLTDAGTTVVSENGSIELNGTGAGTGVDNHGVYIGDATIGASGTGNVNLSGTAGNGTDSNRGIYLLDNATVAATNGTLNVEGFGQGSGDDNYGVYLKNGAVLTSSGVGGSVNVNGTASTTGTSTGFGVYLRDANTQISAANSAVDINVNAFGHGSGSTNVGLEMHGQSQIISNGGNISINAVAGNGGSGDNVGARIQDSGTFIYSIGGDVLLSGQGNGSGSSNFGVKLQGGAVVGSNATGSATINGIAGNGDSSNYGVFIEGNGTMVQVENGDLLINGSGAGANGTGRGVFIQDDALITSSNGTGNITITGAGANGGTTNMGVLIGSNATVSGFGGDILISGNGGAGTNFNYGIDIDGENTTVSNTNGNITIVGIGLGSSNDNVGVNIDNGSDVVVNGTGHINISGTSSAGTTGSHGVWIENPNTTISTTNGDISIQGTSLGTSTDAVGVIHETNATITSTGTGNVSITGTGSSSATHSQGVRISSGIYAASGGIAIQGTGQGASANNDGIRLADGVDVLTNGSTATMNMSGASTGGIAINSSASTGQFGGNNNTGALNISGGGKDIDLGALQLLSAAGGQVGIDNASNVSLSNAEVGSLSINAVNEVEIGSGSINVSSNFNTQGITNISGGATNIGGNFNTTGDVNVSGGTTTVLGTSTLGGNLSVSGGSLNIDGFGNSFNDIAVTAGLLNVTSGGNTVNNVSLTGGTIDLATGFDPANLALLGGNLTGTGVMNAGNVTLPTTGSAQLGLTLSVTGNTNWTGTGSLTGTGSYSNQGVMNVTGTHSMNGVGLQQWGDLNLANASLHLGTALTNEWNISLDSSSVLNVSGGALTNNAGYNITGTGTLFASGGVINNGTISPGASPGTLTIVGDYTQNASGLLNIELNGTTAGTDFDVLNVSGNVDLAGNVNVTELSSFISGGESFEIIKAGSINSSTAAFNTPAGVNMSTAVNAANITLSANSVTNSWILTGSGNWTDANNWLRGVPTIFQDITIDQTGSITVDLASGTQSVNSINFGGGADDSLTVSGGSLIIGSGGMTVPAASNFNISGGTVSLVGNVVTNGGFNWSGGTLAGTGQFNANNGASLTGSATKTLNGPQFTATSITLGDGLFDVSGGTIDYSTLFNINSNGTLQLSGGTLNATNPFSNAGTVNLNSNNLTFSGPGATVVNTGTFNVASGTSLSFSAGGAGTHAGTLNVASGGSLSFTAGTHSFQDGSVLSGAGTISFSGANLGFTGATSGLTIASGSSVTLDGQTVSSGGGKIVNQGSLTLSNQALGFGINLDNQGTLTATGTSNIVSGTTTNSGTINLNAGVMDATSGITQTAGSIVLNGGDLSTTAGSVTLSGGSLSGSGTITGDVSNDGATVAPGASAGLLNIAGNYTQTSRGVLAMEIGGNGTAGTDYDALNVTGAVSLNGTLTETVINGFAAAAGDAFHIIDGSNITGDFSNKSLPVGYSANATATEYVLTSDGSSATSTTSGTNSTVTQTQTTTNSDNQASTQTQTTSTNSLNTLNNNNDGGSQTSDNQDGTSSTTNNNNDGSSSNNNDENDDEKKDSSNTNTNNDDSNDGATTTTTSSTATKTLVCK